MKRIKYVPIVLVIAIIAFIIIWIDFPIARAKDVVHKHKANVKTLNLNTEIEVSSEGTTVYTIKGRIMRLVEDPLLMYDTEGNLIASADDSYHIIAQDTHQISVNGTGEEIKMVGKISFFDEQSYDIFVGEEKVAVAKFNRFNTHGTIKDMSGTVMAEYTSPIIFNDYTVSITSHNIFSEEATDLIMASYYSDQKADRDSKSDDDDDDK